MNPPAFTNGKEKEKRRLKVTERKKRKRSGRGGECGEEELGVEDLQSTPGPLSAPAVDPSFFDIATNGGLPFFNNYSYPTQTTSTTYEIRRVVKR
ncbi:hypothetical protein K439DRAFT_1629092 [Ramaria rubella]|nr:hypothetical protein K439DRAFT_1629092 [Ramaria rubella]